VQFVGLGELDEPPGDGSGRATHLGAASGLAWNDLLRRHGHLPQTRDLDYVAIGQADGYGLHAAKRTIAAKDLVVAVVSSDHRVPILAGSWSGNVPAGT